MENKKRIPQRRCVGCGETKDEKELISVVRTPEGDVCLDLTGKKSGRGAYLCHSRVCFKKARKTGILHRSLECEISEEIYAELEKEIRLAEEENE